MNSRVISKTLENGLKVVYIPHSVNSVTCCLRGLAGSNHETKNEIGAAHLIEHLVTYASKGYPSKNELRGIVLDRGGRIIGVTSRDDVAFLTKTLKKDYQFGLKYLKEIFSEPLLQNQNLETLKKIIYQEIHQNIENPQWHIGRIGYKILYPNQRFSHFNTGNLEDIEKLKYENVIQFYSRQYKPNNFVLSVCGNINTEELFSYIQNNFGLLVAGAPANTPIHEQNTQLSVLVENRADLSQTHIKIDYYGYKTDDNKKYAANFLAKIFNNRLQKTVQDNVTEHGVAAYVVDTASFSSNTFGIFGTYTAINQNHLVEFFKLYKNTIRDLCEVEISDKELETTKNRVLADFEFSLEKTSQRADMYSELILYKNVTNNLDAEVSNYANINKQEITKTARMLFEQKPKITILDSKLTKKEIILAWEKAI
ncbi:insulinase family protein [Patescibacteria group bacterium]|nr:insulinase family protein [Patescibacteria group bacterium]